MNSKIKKIIKKKKRIERTIVPNIMLYLRNFAYVCIFVYLYDHKSKQGAVSDQ